MDGGAVFEEWAAGARAVGTHATGHHPTAKLEPPVSFIIIVLRRPPSPFPPRMDYVAMTEEYQLVTGNAGSTTLLVRRDE
jgi:hypothetical protein